jgi:hypothetical protein
MIKTEKTKLSWSCSYGIWIYNYLWNQCYHHWSFEFESHSGEVYSNATFNNISVLSSLEVLLVEETGVPGENHRPVASHWQTLWHNIVSSTPRRSGIRSGWTHVLRECKQFLFHMWHPSCYKHSDISFSSICNYSTINKKWINIYLLFIKVNNLCNVMF